MFFESRAFWLSKDVGNPTGYQDAFRLDADRGMAAIADGVSASLFAGSWAKILTESVVAEPPEIANLDLLLPWLAKRRQAWLEPIDVSALAWHQKPKFQEGASSTLLWLQMAATDEPEFEIRCFAVGDCCLFHARNNQTLRGFPIENSKQFDLDPRVIGSIDRKHDHLIQFDTLTDRCREGDLLVLCTDALAAWALAQLEAGQSPDWETLWSITEDAFKQKILDLRNAKQIRYDDTTLVMLRIAKPPAPVTAPSTADQAIDTIAEEAKKAVHVAIKTVDDVKQRIQESSAWKWLRGDKESDG